MDETDQIVFDDVFIKLLLLAWNKVSLHDKSTEIATIEYQQGDIWKLRCNLLEADMGVGPERLQPIFSNNYRRMCFIIALIV
ncbi:hypothetical protein CHS0354_021624 [Potamilus streckersoni]|uniref:Uncharacterized protein n=1 Tax=Potamilus streckersoni TaxID=2493646 RepID=A0AAE0SP87_9BIVA|nr:hypothetical protein CHS0354_021624 [Potamilus streckersoni]